MCCWSVGLVQREIEAAGFSTIALSHIPDLTASCGVPRLAAIERPSGVGFGAPGDSAGQSAVLRATLDALAQIDAPGTVVPLPFAWQEPAEKLNLHPTQQPPIVQYITRHVWDLPRLLRRDPPLSR